MRILQVHNFYQQAGGEDQVFAAEHSLLTSRGHHVTQYSVHNDALETISSIQLAAKTFWNSGTYRSVRRLIREQSIQLVHAHNTLPLISPSLYYAAATEGVPVVQTLHNYRLLCPAATLYRNAQVCELCLHKPFKYPSVTYRCYRHNALATATIAGMLAVHEIAGTWRSKIHTYIALTAFSKAKFIEAGFPAAKITVKPNFVPEDPGIGSGSGGYALFLGRLTPEKGLDTLLRTWEEGSDLLPLRIAGDGPMRPEVERRAQSVPNIDYLGHCSRAQIIELLKDAVCLVFPSEWNEVFGLALIEAMACGTPVIASAIGSPETIIKPGINGFLFPPKDTSALSRLVKQSHSNEKLLSLRIPSRLHFEQYYTADRNYEQLKQIYEDTLKPVLR